MILVFTYWLMLSAPQSHAAAFNGPAVDACLLLAAPGDMHFNTGFYMGDPNSIDGKLLYHVGDPFGLFGVMADAVNFRNPYQKYSHASFISEISFGDKGVDLEIKSWSMGFEKTANRFFERYNSNFSIMRAKGGLPVNERALFTARHLSFWKKRSYCSDSLNQVYGGQLTRPAFVESLKGISAILWKIHEAIKDPISSRTTPSSLSRSDQLDKICEVKEGRIVFPKSVKVAKLAEWAKASSQSEEFQLQQHGKNVIEFLRKNKALDEDNKVLIEDLSFPD